MATTLARSSSNGHGRRHEASTISSSSSSSTASAQKRRGESQHQAAVVPATPGPALQFLASPAHNHHHTQTQLVAPRRSVPSKWEDAEKWLRQSSSSSSSGSDHHLHGNAMAAFSRQRSGGLGHRGGAGGGGGDEKSAAVAVRRSVDALRDAHSLALYAAPAAEVLLKGVLWGFYLFIYLFPAPLEFRKTSYWRSISIQLDAELCKTWLVADKFTDNEEPSKESFVFRSSCCCEAAEPAKGAAHDDDGRCQRRRDVGTEMTPLGSSCHTPLKSASPARHNTPASRSSGPLVPYAGGGGGTDISELAGFRLAKLDLGARFGAHATLVGWCSKEEEEDEDVSKSLRHFEATVGAGDCRWDDDDRAKSCIRYQREEAKIQAWVNLESAKAEAQSRKLEVKLNQVLSTTIFVRCCFLCNANPHTRRFIGTPKACMEFKV